MVQWRNIKLLCAALFSTAAALAQNVTPPDASSLPTLERAAKDRTTEWQRLADNLDSSLIRLLPCDPKVAAAIAGVSKASDARIAAVAAYLDASSRAIQLQVNAARQLVSSAGGLSSGLTAERSEVAPERAALESQLANLTQSASLKPSLAAPSDALKQILASEQLRSDSLDLAMRYSNTGNAALAGLVMELEARQAANNGVRSAFESEASQWTAYYAARQARAQMECALTKSLSAPAAKGKQK